MHSIVDMFCGYTIFVVNNCHAVNLKIKAADLYASSVMCKSYVFKD